MTNNVIILTGSEREQNKIIHLLISVIVMFKVFFLFLLGTLLCYSLASLASGGAGISSPVNNGALLVGVVTEFPENEDSNYDEGQPSGKIYVTPVLESVLQAHNLDSAVVGNLMEQHSLDEASLLQLLADVGQTAALVLNSKSD